MMKRLVALICALLLISGCALAETPPRKGERGVFARDLQLRLSELGLYIAPVDDYFGKQTELAIKKLQAALEQPEDGILTVQQYELMDTPEAWPSVQDLREGDQGALVMRLHVRLDLLGYLSGPVDETYSMRTTSAVSWFQRENDLSATGEADLGMQQLLFSSGAKPAAKPVHRYRLFISNDDQRVYAYQWDGSGYGERVLTALCSTGLPNTPTPNGIYRAEGPVSRWCYFPIYGSWARYAYRIHNEVLTHSVLYSKADESTLSVSSVKSLGSKSSHGCIRMSVEEAKWIYDNCQVGTTVVIY
ncbi:L,D-transpeptidase family protein [Eubacteriales bacterium OttesenSCG-928-N13]|nr:L,D-transpeptidase family protein [Eubacteriales bacterium OttesenSCG-928-N13]